jgi:hypothetical protein
MEREAAALLRSAGYRVSWRNLYTDAREDAPLIAVIELNGICAMPSGWAAVDGSFGGAESLAATSITDGQVLPFGTVNCAALTRSLAPVLPRDGGAHRDLLYGRAMGRVVAHELYHILTRTTEHSRSGVARSCFSTGDLLAERFEFEESALAQLRRKPESPAANASVGEDGTGR